MDVLFFKSSVVNALVMDLYLAGCCDNLAAPFPEIMMNTGVDDFFFPICHFHPFSS
jgi:hypothetical protein